MLFTCSEISKTRVLYCQATEAPWTPTVYQCYCFFFLGFSSMIVKVPANMSPWSTGGLGHMHKWSWAGSRILNIGEGGYLIEFELDLLEKVKFCQVGKVCMCWGRSRQRDP